jgi:hypothetical protein
VSPAETDRLLGAAVLSLGTGPLRVAVRVLEKEVELELVSSLGRVPDPAWLALAAGSLEKGVAVRPGPGRLLIRLPRECDADADGELLPHPAAEDAAPHTLEAARRR